MASLKNELKVACLHLKLGAWEQRFNFVQLELLNRVSVRSSKNRAAQGFQYINLCISSIFGPNQKLCICKAHVA